MTTLTAIDATRMIRTAAARLRAEARELSRLDAASGDGDHGANVESAFALAEHRIEVARPMTAAEAFDAVAVSWAEAGGGAAGAVFSTFFNALARGLRVELSSATNLVDGLEAAVSEIQAIGRAREGDKTVLDALVPAATAARSSLADGGDIGAVLGAAAEAAERGARATTGMIPRAGRARYAPSDGLGIADPGATTVAIMLGAWADAIRRPADTAAPSRASRLDRLATPSGQFAILALDHIRSFAATMRPTDPDSMTPQAILDWKARLVQGLAPAATAVLIDPGFAERQATDGRSSVSGLIVGLEDSDYESIQRSPRLIAGWTVERAARLGADAVKVSFSFDPAQGSSDADAFVTDLVHQCEAAQIPLLCEPLADLRAVPDVRVAVVEGVRRFGALGVDVLKIQFPFDTSADSSRAAWADACAEVDETSLVPWALLSEGRGFDEFRELVTIGCRAGASGFVAGRAIWGIALDHPDAIRESASRLSELRVIATGNARSWRAHRGPEAQAQEVTGQAVQN